MKKTFICILLIAAIAGIALAFGGNNAQAAERGEYLRVHIRANSNGEEDQRVKYIVRDGVVKFLTPFVAQCETKEEAMQTVKGLLGEAEKQADKILREHGFTYGARASLRQEEFPTRVYEDVTLSAGVYDALILELGTGEGDNWWCVVYPPLCFAGGNGNVVYKSKIAEIIRNFFGKEN